MGEISFYLVTPIILLWAFFKSCVYLRQAQNGNMGKNLSDWAIFFVFLECYVMINRAITLQESQYSAEICAKSVFWQSIWFNLGVLCFLWHIFHTNIDKQINATSSSILKTSLRLLFFT